MQGKVASFVGGVQLRLKIDETTSNKDDPTPIYLMDEVAQMLGSQNDALALGVDHICRRLGNKAPTVKQKALRLVKHLSQKGSPEFRRHMTKNSTLLRELTHFRCEPDPFKGDIPWKRVQQLAQEALAALHSAPEVQGPASALGGRIQGFGSDAGPGSSSSPGMVGFGSDSLGSTGLSGRGVDYSGGSRMVGFGSDSKPSGGGGYGAMGTGTGQTLLSSISSGVKSLGESLARPQDSLLSQDGYGAASGGDNVGTVSYSSTATPVVGLHGVAGRGAASSGPASQESRAVDKICTPAGLRAAPDRGDLQSFVEVVSSLDGTQVARLLQERMERGPWQATLRALCAVEAVIENGSSASCGEVAVFFQATPEPIRRASGSPQSSVRQRATKLLTLIGDETLPSQGLSSVAAAATKTADSFDLLGDAAANGVPDGAASAPAPAELKPPSAMDLLGDLEGSTSDNVQSQPHRAGSDLSSDLFCGLSVPTGQSDAGASVPGNSSGLDSATGMTSLQSLSHQQRAIPAGTFDFLGDLSQPSASQAAVPENDTSHDLFSHLSMASNGSDSGFAGSQPARPSTSVPAAKPSQQSNDLGDLLSDFHLVGPTHQQQQPMRGSTSASNQHVQIRAAVSQQPVHAGFSQQLPQPQLGLGMMDGMQQQYGAGVGIGNASQQSGIGMQLLGRMSLPDGNFSAPPVPHNQLTFMQQQQQQQQAMMMQMQQLGLNPAQMQLMLQQRALAMQQQQYGWSSGGAIGSMGFPMGVQSQGSLGGSGRSAIPLEEFHDTTSHQHCGIHKKDSSFDFVGDHLQTLKKK